MNKLTQLKTVLSSDKMQEQFRAALPKHLTAERFGRVAITALTRTPKLADCTQESFFKCLLDLSAMGLEPDGRRAHLIPYGKEATLVIDYKGLVELVRRSGDVAKIHADVVCENDTFKHSMGEVQEHSYDLKNERGEPYAVYAQVTLKDGSVQAEIMSKAEVEQIRQKSRAGNSGPWKDHWNEMAKKTAFRRLTKWLTLSPEIMDAVTKAEETEFKGMRDVTPEPSKEKTLESLEALVTPPEVEAEPSSEDLWDKEEKEVSK
jgi:recombination protein RecT